ncbi:MAG TPA: glycosyltransferase family A protein, partial [Candidatus Binataceae bacterium]|nr:glycosyltransferase family A protein [Candidatus Binataceae bacterium]
MSHPLFSVIIPTYARPTELAACLEALARQELDNDSFEVIVVDDGSPTPPDAVVRRFADRLNIRLLSDHHVGPGAARNRGTEAASGTFLAF